MVKGVGTVIILSAAALIYREMRRAQQARCDALCDLRSALEDMAYIIRNLRLPLPDAISRQTDRPYCGEYFNAVSKALQQDQSLANAWENGFSPLDGQEGRILRAVSLQGDEPLLLGQLQYAATQLARLEEQLRSSDHSRRRIQLAATLSIAFLLMIILL